MNAVLLEGIDAQQVILNKILDRMMDQGDKTGGLETKLVNLETRIIDQDSKIDRIEHMTEHIYLDMTNKAGWGGFKQLQSKVAALEEEVEKLKGKNQ